MLDGGVGRVAESRDASQVGQPGAAVDVEAAVLENGVGAEEFDPEGGFDSRFLLGAADFPRPGSYTLPVGPRRGPASLASATLSRSFLLSFLS